MLTGYKQGPPDRPVRCNELLDEAIGTLLEEWQQNELTARIVELAGHAPRGGGKTAG